MSMKPNWQKIGDLISSRLQDFAANWKGIKRLGSQPERGLLMVCFAVFWIDLIHCFLNKSLYSKYILYSLSVIVGMSLVLLEKAGQNKSWQAWRTGQASAIPPLPSKPHR